MLTSSIGTFMWPGCLIYTLHFYVQNCQWGSQSYCIILKKKNQCSTSSWTLRFRRRRRKSVRKQRFVCRLAYAGFTSAATARTTDGKAHEKKICFKNGSCRQSGGGEQEDQERNNRETSGNSFWCMKINNSTQWEQQTNTREAVAWHEDMFAVQSITAAWGRAPSFWEEQTHFITSFLTKRAFLYS